MRGSPANKPRWDQWLTRLQAPIVAGLLVLFFAQATLSARVRSVTVDEFAHLPSGYIYWATGNFFVYHRNPPLIKMWAALPLFRSGLDKQFATRDNLWAAGYDFMFRNEAKYQTLFWRCRLMIALLGVGLGVLVFRWSRELFGVVGGLLSLAAYAFSPNMINHAGIVSTDLGAAATYALACYALYKLCAKWSVWRLAFVGLAFGLAMIAKFTGLILLPLAPLILVLDALLKRRDPGVEKAPWKQDLVRGLITLVVIAVACLVIINAGYAFKGTLKPWREYENEVAPIGTVAKLSPASFPAPFPEAFLRGLSEQRWASTRPQFQFLCGNVSYHGWWYYYAVAFLFKVPIATLVLLVLAVYAGARRFDRRAFVFVAAPALFFFLVFSFGTRVNMGIRYMLPAMTLMFISFGAIVRPDAPPLLRKTALVGVVAGLVVWLVVESAITFPHYLAYFNEFAGGHGERYLIDSNCDCSQDHITLRRYLERHGIERPHLATFGRVDAKVYGVEYETLRPNEPVTGDVIVSINLYDGYPYLTPDNGAEAIRVPKDGYAWLHEYTPVRRIGGSLYHFRIEPKPDAPPAANE
jgi:hypothetical protein